MTLSVSQLYIYPVKSCGGISLKTAEIGKYGLKLDRLWVVTTSDYKFITGRTHPKLVTIRQSLELIDGRELVKLESDFVNRPLILDPEFKASDKEIHFLIHKSEVYGYECGDEAASWFSEAIGEEGLRLLVKSPQPRLVEDLYLERDGYSDLKPETGLADGFPILLASEESLLDLQNNLPEEVKTEVDIRNFRPNIVIKGCSKPFEEDTFGVIKTGTISLHCDKPCSRCSFPNVNPETGIPHKTEPSKTLMKTRRCFPHIAKYQSFFGINAIPLKPEGTISIGEAVEVVSVTEK